MGKNSAKKNTERWERKKKKIKAFLDVARLNDESKVSKQQKMQSKADSNPETLHAVDKKKSPKSISRPMIDRELQRMRMELRERQKNAMDKSKVYPVLDWINIPCAVCPRSESKTNESESLLQPSMDHQLPLFAVDLQQLLMLTIQGNICALKPRWCKLLRPAKLEQVVVIEVTGITKGTFLTEQHQFTGLRDQGFSMCVEVISPLQYSSSFLQEISLVPLSISQRKKRDQAQKELEKRDHQELRTKKTRYAPAPPIKFIQNVPWSHGNHGDGFSRLNLLLSTGQMALENFPLPVDIDNHEDFVYSQEEYASVSQHSPIFAVDCEMCVTSVQQYELTRVALINERLETVYETLVKPHNAITQYLTKYSGITKSMLANIRTSLEDVQCKFRELLPPDAILCGQSLNGDLKALKMFHPYVIDTSVIYNFTGQRFYKPGLKKMAKMLLGKDIQDDPTGHHPVEDAIATMELVLLKLHNGPYFGDVILNGGKEVDTESVKQEPSSTESQTQEPSSTESQKQNLINVANIKSETQQECTATVSAGDQAMPTPAAEDSRKRTLDSERSDLPHHSDSHRSDHKKAKTSIDDERMDCDSNSNCAHSHSIKTEPSTNSVTDTSNPSEKEDGELLQTDCSINSADMKPEPPQDAQKLVFFRRQGTDESESFFKLAKEADRRVMLIGRETMLTPWSTDHHSAHINHIPADTNTSCHRYAKCAVRDDNFMVWAQFQCEVPRDENYAENLEAELSSIQHHIKKITKKCRQSSLVLVLLSGDEATTSRSNAVCLAKIT